jgi:tRNA-intron endonuclease, archaea type
MITLQLNQNKITSNSKEAFSLFEKSLFGEKHSEKIEYSIFEAYYLIESKKAELVQKNKTLSNNETEKKFSKIDKKFNIKYPVFKDLRKKGYLVKSALKFGAEFRVYGKDFKKNTQRTHAKWLVFTDSENNKISWNEFSAKNRVAHSTRKKLLLAILDNEGKIIYYEIVWVKI